MASPSPDTNNKPEDASEAEAEAEETEETVIAADESASAPLPSCLNDPNFAIICAFLQKFAGKLNITYPNFRDLQLQLENTDELAEDLKLLIIKLLRKTRKNVPMDKWEHAVSKFCYGYSTQDAWEIERFGFKKASLAVKLRVLKEIMECQFERNVKFKADVNLVEANELRSQPIGKDSFGNSYWSLTDEELNLRIYQEHLDEDIWKVVANNRDELVQLIACLRGNDIKMMPSAIGVVDEDSSSNSMSAAPKVDALKDGAQKEEDDDDGDEREPVAEIVKTVETKEVLPTVVSMNNLAATENADDSSEEGGQDEVEEEEDEEGGEEEEDDEEDDEDDENSDESDAEGSSESESDSGSSETSKTPSKQQQELKRPSLLASKPPSNKVTPPKKTQSSSFNAAANPNSSQANNNKSSTTRKRSQPMSSSDDDEDEEEDSPNKIIKLRPTLLVKTQTPKTNKYANLKQNPSTKAKHANGNDNDDDEDDDDDDDEDDDEDDDDDDDEEDEDSDDEEDDDQSEEEEEDDNEVGDEIEEPVMYVKGVGSGKANQGSFADFLCEVGEAIEEEVFHVFGDGSGEECMVGNPGDNNPPTQSTSSSTSTTSEDTPPQPKFFFGQPGCLKLSPIKKTTTPAAATDSSVPSPKSFSIFDDDFGVPSKKSILPTSEVVVIPDSPGLKVELDNLSGAKNDFGNGDKDHGESSKCTISEDLSSKQPEKEPTVVNDMESVNREQSADNDDKVNLNENVDDLKESSETTHTNNDNQSAKHHLVIIHKETNHLNTESHNTGETSIDTNAIEFEQQVNHKMQISDQIIEIDGKNMEISTTDDNSICTDNNVDIEKRPETEKSSLVSPKIIDNCIASDIQVGSSTSTLNIVAEETKSGIEDETSLDNTIINQHPETKIENKTDNTECNSLSPQAVVDTCSNEIINSDEINETSTNVSREHAETQIIVSNVNSEMCEEQSESIDDSKMLGESSITTQVPVEMPTDHIEQHDTLPSTPLSKYSDDRALCDVDASNATEQNTLKISPESQISAEKETPIPTVESNDPNIATISIEESIGIDSSVGSSQISNTISTNDLSNDASADVTEKDLSPNLPTNQCPKNQNDDIILENIIPTTKPDLPQLQAKTILESGPEVDTSSDDTQQSASPVRSKNSPLANDVANSPTDEKIAIVASDINVTNTNESSVDVATEDHIADTHCIENNLHSTQSLIDEQPVLCESDQLPSLPLSQETNAPLLITPTSTSSEKVQAKSAASSIDEISITQDSVLLHSTLENNFSLKSTSSAVQHEPIINSSTHNELQSDVDNSLLLPKDLQFPSNTTQDKIVSVQPELLPLNPIPLTTIKTPLISKTEISHPIIQTSSQPPPKVEPVVPPTATHKSVTANTPPNPPKVRLTWSVLKNLAEGRPSILSQPPAIDTQIAPVVPSSPAENTSTNPTRLTIPQIEQQPTETPEVDNQLESPKFSSILDPPSPTSSSNPGSFHQSEDTSDSQVSTAAVIHLSPAVQTPLPPQTVSSVVPNVSVSSPILQTATDADAVSVPFPKKQTIAAAESASVSSSITNTTTTTTATAAPIGNRKRRISTSKQRLNSESSDFGDTFADDTFAAQDLEDDEEVVAQKRPKMRARCTQSDKQRREAENKRNIKQADWSTDEEDVRRNRPMKKIYAAVVAAAEIVSVDTSKSDDKEIVVSKTPEPVVKHLGRGTRNSLRNATIAASAACSSAVVTTPKLESPGKGGAKGPKGKKDIDKDTPPTTVVEETSKKEAQEPAPAVIETSITVAPDPPPPKPKPLTKKEKEKLKREAAKAKQLEKKQLAEKQRLEKAAAEKDEKAAADQAAQETKKFTKETDDVAAKETPTPASINKDESSTISVSAQPPATPIKPTTTTTTSAEPPKSEPARRRKKRSLMGLDIDETVLEQIKDETPVRQSRRIAQIKIKEEAERRDMEEIALNKLKAASDRKKSIVTQVSSSAPRSEASYKARSDESDSDASVSNDNKRGSKKKKKKLPKGANPWQTDSDGEASDGDAEDALYEQHYESDHKLGALKSDHEFSPESDLENDIVVPVKRARTARKDEWVENDEDEDEYACQKCGKHDHPEWILLCDKCDKGYHCSCLVPMLFLIPEGDWFCPPCQQEQLIGSLETQLIAYEKALVEKKAEELQRIKEEELARNTIKEEEVKDEYEEDEEPPEKFSTDTSRRRKPPRNRNRRRPRDSDSEVSENSSRSSSNKSSSGSGSNSSDDEPIYKLRKRRQTGVSYMFNEYDHLIDKAIKKEMDAAEGLVEEEPHHGKVIPGTPLPKVAVKKPRCGKEMSSDTDEDDKADSEPEKKHRTGKHMPGEEDDTDEELQKKKKTNDDDDSDESIIRRPKQANRGTGKSKKKSRKLNSLDIESEDDGSDDDFRTSSFSEDEEEDEQFSASDSDSSLEAYKRRKGKKDTRRSSRARRKRIDKDFINDSDDDDDDLPLIKKTRKKGKKKIDSDYSDFNDDGSTDEDAEDLDSNDLCDDTDSNDSDGAWGSSKRKKKAPARKAPVKTTTTSDFGGKGKKKAKPKEEDGEFKVSLAKPKHPIARKSDHSDDDDEESDKSSDDDSENETTSKSKKRRTRGNKLTYLLDDFESSDDGIKPGVKRPDTPPEERAAFIKRQEDIKRMLAEKNTEAAKALAAPKICSISSPDKRRNAAPDSLSTIPLQIIQSAKALDVDLRFKGKESDIEDPFDDDLPDDFDPEDMDEDEIAKMMEEEDFAQQQLKLAGEAIRSKKAKEAEQTRKKDISKDDTLLPSAGPSTEVIPPQPVMNVPHGNTPGPSALPLGMMGSHPMSSQPQMIYGQGQQHPQGPRGNYLEQMRALGQGLPGQHPIQHGQRYPSAGTHGIRHPGSMPGSPMQQAMSGHPGHSNLPPGHPAHSSQPPSGHPGQHGPAPQQHGHPTMSQYRHSVPPGAHGMPPGAHGHASYHGPPQGHPMHGHPPGPHRPPTTQHHPNNPHQGPPGLPPHHGPNHPHPGMHSNAPMGSHNQFGPRAAHQMMYGPRGQGNQHPQNMPPGAQMSYGIRGPPSHFGARQMMHDPRQAIMNSGTHPSSSPIEYPQDSKILKLTKTGVEPKKRGRKSKAEIHTMDGPKPPQGYPGAANSPPGLSMGHMHPQMASSSMPSMLTNNPVNAPPPSLISAPGPSVPPGEPMIPTSVLAVQNTRLIDPSELGPPGTAAAAAAAAAAATTSEEPAKKRGRRKKFTPLRENLVKSGGGVDLSASAAKPPAPTENSTEPKPTSILSDRLTGGRSPTLSVATQPQLYTPGSVPSVITRLPRSQPPFESHTGGNNYPPNAQSPSNPTGSTSPNIRHPYPGMPPHGAPPPLTPVTAPAPTTPTTSSAVSAAAGNFQHSTNPAEKRPIPSSLAPGMYRHPYPSGPPTGYSTPPGPPPPMHRGGPPGGPGIEGPPSAHSFPHSSYGPSYGNYYAPPQATSPAVRPPSSTPPVPHSQTHPQLSPTTSAADRSRLPPQPGQPPSNHPPPPTKSPPTTTSLLTQPKSVVVSAPVPVSRSFEQFDNAPSLVKHNSPDRYRTVDEDGSSGPMGNDSNSSIEHRHHTTGAEQVAPKSPEVASGSSEFSGLVSYFSSQQDDLES